MFLTAETLILAEIFTNDVSNSILCTPKISARNSLKIGDKRIFLENWLWKACLTKILENSKNLQFFGPVAQISRRCNKKLIYL